MKYPNGPPRLVNFVENAIDVSPLTEEETTNLTPCALGLARRGAAIGEFFERV
jgi:hypothetical protein